MVASLWKCVFSKDDSEWLADVVRSIPLTLDYWLYQKHLYPTDLRQSALKCLYLNRTSFSGILHESAGPIGGKAQKNWAVGCRFNREKLSSRILELSRLSDRVISVSEHSWVEVCNEWSNKGKGVFFYLDPPFYHKAERLYRFVFNDDDHSKLRNHLAVLERPWILSYDNASEIRDLYGSYGLNARIIDNTYSAHPLGGNSFIGRELIYSNLPVLPPPARKKAKHVGLSVRKLEKGNPILENLIRIRIHHPQIPFQPDYERRAAIGKNG